MFATAALLLSLASAALTAPQSYTSAGGSGSGGNFPIVPIIKDNRNGPQDGYYDFSFETGDGISRNEQGAPTGPDGAVVQQGAWSFTFPDGTPAQFSFVADEGGYRVESPLLPTPPPIPAHALEQIERARQEDAQGIFYDDQGFRISGGSRPQSGGNRPQSYN